MRIKSLLLAVLLGGCLTTAQADHHMKANAGMADPNQEKAQVMIDNAEKARKKAASVEGEWRDTGKKIKQAQAALKKGDTVNAMKLASQAHKQGVLGYQQATAQKELRMPNYVKY